MLTAFTIHLFHVEKFFVAFLRLSQRAFWPKRFSCQLAVFSAIQKNFSSCFTRLFLSFWDKAPARATPTDFLLSKLTLETKQKIRDSQAD